MSIYEKLSAIQAKLKAPKNQFNSFGNYNYRSCEDILEGVKPLLLEFNLTQTISDEIVLIGNRYYVKATVTITDLEDLREISVSAYAREEESKKGMDGSQVTGSCSSYARKYALNGLYAIDDSKDSDATNTHGKDEPAKRKSNHQNNSKQSQNSSKTGEATVECKGCGVKISAKVANYSVGKFKKPLCMDCQKKQ